MIERRNLLGRSASSEQWLASLAVLSNLGVLLLVVVILMVPVLVWGQGP